MLQCSDRIRKSFSNPLSSKHPYSQTFRGNSFSVAPATTVTPATGRDTTPHFLRPTNRPSDSQQNKFSGSHQIHGSDYICRTRKHPTQQTAIPLNAENNVLFYRGQSIATEQGVN